MKAVIFDLDGTIADTLPLCVTAFKESIEPLANRSFSTEEIIATFGPTEEGTVRQLVPTHYKQALADYHKHYETLHDMCPRPFDGIPELITLLKRYGIRVAMVTGKGRESTRITLARYGLSDTFEMIETGSPDGPRKEEGIDAVIKKMQVAHHEVIYIGDAPSDVIASRKAGVHIFSAAWAGTASITQLKALEPDQIFESVCGLYLHFSELLSAALSEEILLAFKRVKSVADTGLLYCKEDYGRERYHELEDIALTSISKLTSRSISTIRNFYDKVTDYPTPKVDVRAFIVNEQQQILMVKERADSCWTLPGGWADIGLTPSECVIKEVKEETGLDAEVIRLMAVFDKKKYPHPPQPFYVYKMVFHCRITGAMTFNKAFDVLDIRFFDINDLPALSEDRIVQSQVRMLFAHFTNGQQEVIID